MEHPDTGFVTLWDRNFGTSVDTQWVVLAQHLPDGSILNTNRISIVTETSWDGTAEITSTPYGHLYLSYQIRQPLGNRSRIGILRIDPTTLTPIWAKNYRQDSSEIAPISLMPLQNGDVLIFGEAHNFQTGNPYFFNPYMLRVDSMGGVVWDWQVHQNWMVVHAALEAPNGTIYACIQGGYTSNSDGFGFAKIDAAGNTDTTVWFQATQGFSGRRMQFLGPNRIAAVGDLYDATFELRLPTYIVFDTLGNIISAQSYTGMSAVWDAQYSSNGFVLGGSGFDMGQDTFQMMIAKIDDFGNPLWARYYDDDFAIDSAIYGYANSILPMPDGGLLFAANTSDQAEANDVLIRTDSNGFGPCNFYDTLLTPQPYVPTALSLTPNDTTIPLTDTITSIFQQPIVLDDSLRCFVACVWPGDTDNDGIAHNVDLLNIGLAYGQAGTPRTSISTNWACHTAAEWPTNFASGLNHNFADTNGDGIVNDDDTLAIHLNYNATHNKTHTPAATSSTPDLILAFDVDTAFVGDTVYGAVLLGNANLPADSIYGLAFTLLYDNELVDSGSAWIRFDSSFFGDSSNTLTLSRDFWTLGVIDGAVVRTDQFDASGYGQIATLGFILIDNIEGKRHAAKTLHAGWSDVETVMVGGGSTEVSAAGDSLVVLDPEIGRTEESVDMQGLRVYPNPARDVLQISVARGRLDAVEVLDLSGKVVMRETPGRPSWTWHTADFARGMYLLRVRGGAATAYRRVILN
ncbi:MAG: T9SS type A sorting domain-containing protein [Bacteroidota bacterium]